MIEFNGGGKTQFSPEKQAIIEKSVAMLEATTGLKVVATRCCPWQLEFDLISPTGVSIQSIKYTNEDNGIVLSAPANDFDYRVIGANRQFCGLLQY